MAGHGFCRRRPVLRPSASNRGGAIVRSVGAHVKRFPMATRDLLPAAPFPSRQAGIWGASEARAVNRNCLRLCQILELAEVCDSSSTSSVDSYPQDDALIADAPHERVADLRSPFRLRQRHTTRDRFARRFGIRTRDRLRIRCKRQAQTARRRLATPASSARPQFALRPVPRASRDS